MFVMARGDPRTRVFLSVCDVAKTYVEEGIELYLIYRLFVHLCPIRKKEVERKGDIFAISVKKELNLNI